MACPLTFVNLTAAGFLALAALSKLCQRSPFFTSYHGLSRNDCRWIFTSLPPRIGAPLSFLSLVAALFLHVPHSHVPCSHRPRRLQAHGGCADFASCRTVPEVVETIPCSVAFLLGTGSRELIYRFRLKDVFISSSRPRHPYASVHPMGSCTKIP